MLLSTSCESVLRHPVQDRSLWRRQKHYFRLERQCRAAAIKKGCCRAVNTLADPEHSMQGVPVSASKMDSDGSLEVWVADGMTPRRRPIVRHVQPSWSAGRTTCGPGVGFTLPIILVDSHSADHAAGFARPFTRRTLVTNGQLGARRSSLILESLDAAACASSDSVCPRQTWRSRCMAANSDCRAFDSQEFSVSHPGFRGSSRGFGLAQLVHVAGPFSALFAMASSTPPNAACARCFD